MNKDILKLLKAELKDDMKSRGFKTEGQWYMRLANSQIYQTVFIQGSKYGDEFTVNIGFEPLCTGNIYPKNPNCQTRLGSLANGRDKWWSFTEVSAKDAAAFMRETAFPLFGDCVTYRGLFDLIKSVIDGSGSIAAKEIFSRIPSVEWARLSVSLNELEYCKRLLNNSIRKWEEHIRREQYKDVFIKRAESDKALLAKIESEDLDDIKAKIKQNEKRSLDALTKYNVKV